jgi:hypothetical protein
MKQSSVSTGRPLSYRDVLSMMEVLHLKSFDWQIGPNSRDSYVECHSKRYAHLLNTIGELLGAQADPGRCTVLDIGPYFQTSLLQALYPTLQIDSLGFIDPSRLGFVKDIVRRHHDFDLNDFHYDDREPGIGHYDIMLFCEVVEHLYTMPETILSRLKPHLKPGGAIIVQTPNAVQWRHRARMLAGHNPFQRIAQTRNGHYREYTAVEICEIAAAAGFEVRSLQLRNYFGLRKRFATTVIDNLLWPIAGLRMGITAVLVPEA